MAGKGPINADTKRSRSRGGHGQIAQATSPGAELARLCRNLPGGYDWGFKPGYSGLIIPDANGKGQFYPEQEVDTKIGHCDKCRVATRRLVIRRVCHTCDKGIERANPEQVS